MPPPNPRTPNPAWAVPGVAAPAQRWPERDYGLVRGRFLNRRSFQNTAVFPALKRRLLDEWDVSLVKKVTHWGAAAQREPCDKPQMIAQVVCFSTHCGCEEEKGAGARPLPAGETTPKPLRRTDKGHRDEGQLPGPCRERAREGATRAEDERPRPSFAPCILPFFTHQTLSVGEKRSLFRVSVNV